MSRAHQPATSSIHVEAVVCAASRLTPDASHETLASAGRVPLARCARRAHHRRAVGADGHGGRRRHHGGTGERHRTRGHRPRRQPVLAADAAHVRDHDGGDAFCLPWNRFSPEASRPGFLGSDRGRSFSLPYGVVDCATPPASKRRARSGPNSQSGETHHWGHGLWPERGMVHDMPGVRRTRHCSLCVRAPAPGWKLATAWGGDARARQAPSCARPVDRGMRRRDRRAADAERGTRVSRARRGRARHPGGSRLSRRREPRPAGDDGLRGTALPVRRHVLDAAGDVYRAVHADAEHRKNSHPKPAWRQVRLDVEGLEWGLRGGRRRSFRWLRRA